MYVMFNLVHKVEEDLDIIKKKIYNLLDEHLPDYNFSMSDLFVGGMKVDFKDMQIDGDLDD